MADVKFGTKSAISSPTPKWATWTFRIFFYVSSFVTFIIATDGTIPQATALQIIKWLAITTVAVHGFSKMWGIDTKNAFNQSPKN